MKAFVSATRLFSLYSCNRFCILYFLINAKLNLRLSVMRIALIAHDKKKQEMIEIAKKYKDTLAKHTLYATGTTGTLVMKETGLNINRMKSGPLGGDQQIGSMIACNELDLVIFLRDPLTAPPHEPDVSALLRLCDVTNTPLATNIASAEIMLVAFSRNEITNQK